MKTLIAVSITNNYNNIKNIVKDLNNQSIINYDVIIWNNMDKLNSNTYLEGYADRSVGYKIKLINSKINLFSFGAYVAVSMVLS